MNHGQDGLISPTMPGQHGQKGRGDLRTSMPHEPLGREMRLGRSNDHRYAVAA
jgi:hypothetical protein